LYRALTFRSLFEILVDSARSSAAVGVVIGGAFILNYIVIAENIPAFMSTILTDIDIHPLLFLLLINILILVLGCFLDATTIILVIVPLFIPACKALGIDLVHFGVLVVVNSMIGLITPPYGILLFVINAVTGIPIKEIIGEIWLFFGVLILALITLIFFPDLVLWLPKMLGYTG
jgi:TRAP-type C4-dicarboxylate transport system, large permease component